jgi:hypothetical protein
MTIKQTPAILSGATFVALPRANRYAAALNDAGRASRPAK